MNNVFSTLDYEDRFPDLAAYMAEVSFPQPFTLGDYKKWFRALNLTDKEEKNSPLDDIVFLRQYKAAMAVVQVTPVTADEVTPVVVDSAVGIDEYEIDLGRFGLPRQPIHTDLLGWDNADLPIPFASYLVEIADKYIGDQLIVETDAARLERRLAETYNKPAFRHDHCLELLPGMADWRGYVVYQSPLSASVFREWSKTNDKIKGDPREINNHRFIRAVRAAGSLVQEFKFQGLDWATCKANDYARLPLVVASFLVETADSYLARRASVKKLPRPSNSGR